VQPQSHVGLERRHVQPGVFRDAVQQLEQSLVGAVGGLPAELAAGARGVETERLIGQRRAG